MPLPRLTKPLPDATGFALVFAWLLVGAMVSGADTEPPAGPKVEPLGENRFRLGLIEFDSTTREIRIPCAVNAKDGILEYVLVHRQGKTHESLLNTEVSPLHLQIVLKLLSYRQGKGDLLDPFLPPGPPAAPEPAGEAVEILVSWETALPHPVNNVIRDEAIAGPLAPGPWVCTGSEIINGVYQAEVEGSIIALYRDPLSMFNSPHERMIDDENWVPIGSFLPAIDHPVTLTIRPVKAPEPAAP